MKTASSLPARATAILNNKTAKHIDILDSKAFKLPRLLSQRILYRPVRLVLKTEPALCHLFQKLEGPSSVRLN